jgi:hypothetical protein
MIGSLILTVVLIIILGFDKVGWVCSFGDAIKNGISLSPLIGVICMALSMLLTSLQCL